MEKKATGLCVYGLYAVPGLLQTADYVRAGFELERPSPDEEDIERGVSAGLARQEIDECVEVAWRKSSYSGAEGGDCVEVAAAATHAHIRDSKQVSGPMLTVGPGAWAGFIGLVAPHLVRPFVGYDPARTLVPAGLAGAALLVAADCAVRLIPSGSEVKIGVLTTVLGVPFLLWIIGRRKAELSETPA